MTEHIHPESYQQLVQLVKLHGMRRILDALREIAETKMLQDFLDQMVADWFGLLGYCTAEDFDRIQFKARLDFWARQWGRLSWGDQGYVCGQIAIGLKS